MKELTDIQKSADDRQISIDRVGVKGLRYPLEVADKFQRVQPTVAEVTLAVDLPQQYKGTHMSRFIEVLSSHGPRLEVHSITRIPKEISARLEAKQVHCKFEFPFFREKQAPVSEKKSLLDYEICFEVDYSAAGGMDFIVTVAVPVTTLCPCSKTISEYGAHNQRGVVKFSVRFSDEPIWIEDLITLVESCASAELYSLLKRPDEKFVTEQAYDNPVFVEDLVRNVACKANAQSAISWYCVEAENFESIHNHNAYAMIERDKR